MYLYSHMKRDGDGKKIGCVHSCIYIYIHMHRLGLPDTPMYPSCKGLTAHLLSPPPATTRQNGHVSRVFITWKERSLGCCQESAKSLQNTMVKTAKKHMSISTNPIPENTGWIVNNPMMG